MEKKHFGFFQTAETWKRAPNCGVKGSGANHYPKATAPEVNRVVHYLALAIVVKVV